MARRTYENIQRLELIANPFNEQTADEEAQLCASLDVVGVLLFAEAGGFLGVDLIANGDAERFFHRHL